MSQKSSNLIYMHTIRVLGKNSTRNRCTAVFLNDTAAAVANFSTPFLPFFLQFLNLCIHLVPNFFFYSKTKRKMRHFEIQNICAYSEKKTMKLQSQWEKIIFWTPSSLKCGKEKKIMHENKRKTKSITTTQAKRNKKRKERVFFFLLVLLSTSYKTLAKYFKNEYLNCT